MHRTTPLFIVAIFVAFIVLVAAVSSAKTLNGFASGYGTPLTVSYGKASAQMPTYADRTCLVLVNVARMSPAGYISKYQPAGVTSMTSVPPLYDHIDLVRVARGHSEDMASNSTCFQHDSCDGTNWATRVKSMYTESGTLAENIASGYSGPEAVIQGWIESPGHRTNMMNGVYTVMGNGKAASKNLWTQDFAGGPQTVTNPIVAGSHLYNSTHLTFYANFYQQSTLNSAPTEASVVVNGVAYAMSLAYPYQDSASTKQGTFVSAAIKKGSSGCMGYYFRFRASGASASNAYPEAGLLQSYDGGSTCSTDYTAGAQPQPSPVPVVSVPQPQHSPAASLGPQHSPAVSSPPSVHGSPQPVVNGSPSTPLVYGLLVVVISSVVAALL